MIDRLRRLLNTGNGVRFLLSFILAFALWAWVTVERDPEQTFRASNVPVAAEDVPAELEIVGSLGEVDVVLQGPRSIIQTIDAGAVRATVDLSEVDGPGIYEVPVEVHVPDGVRKVDIDPREIVVELDRVTAEAFDIDVTPPTTLPRGLSVTDITVSPERARVIGVARNVARVAKLVAPVDVEGRMDSFTIQVEPIPYDADNNPVENVSVEPGVVAVDVDLAVRGKEVPVFVPSVGNAAEGYAVIGQPQPSPSSVLIDGPPEALNDIQYLYTVSVDTSELTEPAVIPDVPLDTGNLPEGVTVEPGHVDVSVRVEQAVFSKTFDNIPVQVLNAQPNTRVTVDPPTVMMTVEGQQEVVANLNEQDIGIVVDVTGLGPGAHQVRPRVMLPPNVEYSDPPGEVVVAIMAVEPTPTPAPTATPAAGATSTP